MVELKAVEAPFPLYGSMVLEGGQPYSHALLKGQGALVRPEVLTTLGLRVGESIVIGQSTFTIRGVIASEPGAGMGQFSLGPRVFVDFADVPATGLLGFGSRATRQVLVESAGGSHRRAGDDRCGRSSATSSSTCGRTARTRIRSAATSIARRTT